MKKKESVEAQQNIFNSDHIKGFVLQKQDSRLVITEVKIRFPLLCEHVKIDRNGFLICLYNLETPDYCEPRKCPYLKQKGDSHGKQQKWYIASI